MKDLMKAQMKKNSFKTFEVYLNEEKMEDVISIEFTEWFTFTEEEFPKPELNIRLDIKKKGS